MQNRFLIDWLSFTTKIHTPGQILDLLGLYNVSFNVLKGACGYSERMYFDGISIHYGGNNDTVWLEMSGKGCRNFETFGNGDFDSLFKLICTETEDINVTRLDIAFDDFSGTLDINTLCADTITENFVSKWRKYEVTISNGGNTILHGSRKSDTLLRIYDKAAEQKLLDRHWIRVELQMRDERAFGFIRSYCTGMFKLGEIFLSVVSNYVRYLEPNTSDTNKSRWKTKDYWLSFIGEVEKISIYVKPGINYNIGNLQHFVIEQAGNALKTYIDICGLESLVNEIGSRSYRKNPKYESLKYSYEYWRSSSAFVVSAQ